MDDQIELSVSAWAFMILLHFVEALLQEQQSIPEKPMS
jgi:hypothetical protein